MKKIIYILLASLFLFLPSVFAKGRVVLSPQEAFSYSVTKGDNALLMNLTPSKHIYVYDNKIKFEIIKPKKVDLTKDIKLPPYVQYKEWQVHFDPVDAKIPFSLIKQHVNSNQITFRLTFQGCSKDGICYAPIHKDYEFDLNSPASTQKSSNLTQEESIALNLKNSSFLVTIATFFGFGLLLALTPCIFPMIPILSSIIVAQTNKSGKIGMKHSFMLSLVYVLAMSLAYTVAGVLAGLFGSNIQVLLQNPWVIGTFSAIFVLLSLSMFGFYELAMPKFIQNRITKTSSEMEGRGYIGVAIMGFLSALIVGPCVAAPLAGALVYIGQSGDALLGGLALFVMSLGMGMPLLAIGLGAGKYMPKPGAWMNRITAVFGVVMLAMAIWMLARFVDGTIILFLWTFLAMSSAIYMGALESLGDNASGWKKLIKSIAVILFVYSLFLFVGAFSHATDPLNPLGKILENRVASTTSNSVAQGEKSLFTRVKTLKELKNIVATSKKPIVLDFYADWCVSCLELGKYTFADKRVIAKFQDFTVLQVDVTKNSDEDFKIQKEFGLYGPPAILFFKDGVEQKPKRIIGFIEADKFLEHLDSI